MSVLIFLHESPFSSRNWRLQLLWDHFQLRFSVLMLLDEYGLISSTVLHGATEVRQTRTAHEASVKCRSICTSYSMWLPCRFQDSCLPWFTSFFGVHQVPNKDQWIPMDTNGLSGLEKTLTILVRRLQLASESLHLRPWDQWHGEGDELCCCCMML